MQANTRKGYAQSRREHYKARDDVFAKHQRRIAIDTLKMSDIGALIMGGMTKEEARTFLGTEASRYE